MAIIAFISMKTIIGILQPTFISPWGRYRYKVAPQGYIASGDGYTRHFDEIVSDVPDMTQCADDSLLWSDTLESSFSQAVDWLDLCGRNDITLHPEKFQFGRDKLLLLDLK